MTLNDFKSIVGDTKLGIRSLPVQLGVDKAARLACLLMLLPQLVVIALLFHWQKPFHALAVIALTLIQLWLMRSFLQQPIERARWYSGTGVTLYVLGMMITALALRTVVM